MSWSLWLGFALVISVVVMLYFDFKRQDTFWFIADIGLLIWLVYDLTKEFAK